jgi:hypothetical protein
VSDKLSNVRNWTVGSAIAALILLSPVFALLMFITAEMLIDLLMEGGATAVWAVAASGMGWVLFRNLRPRRAQFRWAEVESSRGTDSSDAPHLLSTASAGRAG